MDRQDFFNRTEENIEDACKVRYLRDKIQKLEGIDGQNLSTPMTNHLQSLFKKIFEEGDGQ